jgi:hypothetical protein
MTVIERIADGLRIPGPIPWSVSLRDSGSSHPLLQQVKVIPQAATAPMDSLQPSRRREAPALGVSLGDELTAQRGNLRGHLVL